MPSQTMQSVAILYPAFAMFFLTIGCFFYLGFSRFSAIHARQVKISFYRTYTEGSQPERLHLLARHVQNHFEVPPVFYVAVLMAYLTQNQSMIALVFAWLFVAARCIHSLIHLGGNNVSQRFFVFGFSLICLTGLWLSNAYELVMRGLH